MTPTTPLTPHAALGWLRSLSIDIESAALLDADGAVLAGDAGLSPPPTAPRVLVVRSHDHALVVRHGRQALTRLLEADARAALSVLEAG